MGEEWNFPTGLDYLVQNPTKLSQQERDPPFLFAVWTGHDCYTARF